MSSSLSSSSLLLPFKSNGSRRSSFSLGVEGEEEFISPDDDDGGDGDGEDSSAWRGGMIPFYCTTSSFILFGKVSDVCDDG